MESVSSRVLMLILCRLRQPIRKLMPHSLPPPGCAWAPPRQGIRACTSPTSTQVGEERLAIPSCLMMLRRLSITPAYGLALVISMLFCSALSLADAQSSSGDAYAAIERARAHSGKSVDASVFDSIALQLEIADRISKDYPTQAGAFRARAARWTKAATDGSDP